MNTWNCLFKVFAWCFLSCRINYLELLSKYVWSAFFRCKMSFVLLSVFHGHLKRQTTEAFCDSGEIDRLIDGRSIDRLLCVPLSSAPLCLFLWRFRPSQFEVTCILTVCRRLQLRQNRKAVKSFSAWRQAVCVASKSTTVSAGGTTGSRWMFFFSCEDLTEQSWDVFSEMNCKRCKQ